MALIARYPMNGNANNVVTTWGDYIISGLGIDSSIGLRSNWGGTDDRMAQSITITGSNILKSIRVKIAKGGSPTGNISCKVYTGQDTGYIGTATNTISESSLSGTYTDCTFNFDNLSFTGGNIYFFFETTRTYDGSNYSYFQRRSTDGYAGGTCFNINSSNVWTGVPGDLNFIATLSQVQALNGTASNVNWVDGKENGAGSFNGTSSQVSIAHNSVLDIRNDITLRCWVNLTATPASTYRGFIDKTASSSYFFGIGTNTLGLNFYYSNSQLNTGAVLTVGKWHRVGVTYNRSSQTVKFFVDGNIVQTNTGFNPTVTGNTNVVYLGRQQTTGYNINGKLDLCDIMNNTVTEAEIKNDYLLTAGFYGQ